MAPPLMDGISETRLSSVQGLLADKIRLVAEAFLAQFPTDPLRVIQGFRSFDQQKHLWDEGRDAAGNVIDEGRIVTHAAPGHSWHEFGCATDVCPSSLILIPGWSPNSARWQVLGTLGEAQGLTWGGRWAKMKDLPHFQLTGKLPVSPDNATRELYASGGVMSVWRAAGLLDPVGDPAIAPAGATAPATAIVASAATTDTSSSS